jgi:cation transport protein ChaC
MTLLLSPPRDASAMLRQAMTEWGGQEDLWVFGYASLIWRPEFDFAEQRPAHVHGYHRALKMWSRLNRGTPDCPGLVFALLPGGSCKGVSYRVPRHAAAAALNSLWEREMPSGVYNPKWLPCQTQQGPVRALTFTLSRHSPNYTGQLSESAYRQIFSSASGRFGSTLDYARQTYDCLKEKGIHDTALRRMLGLVDPDL